MSDRSASFNNAGVRVLMMEAGHEVAALDLFRGALESKLVFERDILHAENPASDPNLNHPPSQEPEQQAKSEPEECIERAEVHLQNLEAYLTPVPPTMPNAEPPSEPAAADGSPGAIVVPLSSRGYDPYIFTTPFSIPEDSNLPTQILSSKIVFNLGLVHQRVNRQSPATAVFYEISAALLPGLVSTPDTLLLRVALLNNFGVWCFENGDGDSMRTSMEHLTIALKYAHTESGGIDAVVQKGIRSNIQWLLTPLNGGSPAA